MLFTVIQDNFVTVFMIIMLFVFLCTGSTLSRKYKNDFFTALIIVVILLAVDIITFIAKSSNKYVLAADIAFTIGFAIRPSVMLPFIQVTDVVSKQHMRILNIIEIINATVAIISFKTHLIYRIDSQNNFHKEILYFLPYIVSAIFLIALVAASIKKFRIGYRTEAFVLFVLCIGIILSLSLELFFRFDFLTTGMAAICSVFYYMFYHTQIYNRDAMTGALNRHSFYSDSKKVLRKKMFIVSMDLNNLKTINDTMGHTEGDKAIKTVAETVFSSIPMNYRFYRMGGDEFALLCPKATESQITSLIKDIEEKIDSKGYKIAAGYSEFDPEHNFEKAFNNADRMMYENKKHMKSRLSDDIMK